MKPIEVSCPRTEANGTNCSAQSGQECMWLNPDGTYTLGRDVFHAERIRDAASISDSAGDPPTVEEMAKATESVVDDIL
jgi:hypothetical protein